MSDFKVDFIGIGFPRCGTTWLSKCLSEHPEICFSDIKEAHYFDLDYHYEKGLSFYEKQFSHCQEGQIVGEFTPEYIREPEKCAERIRKDFPNTKLIVVMRDPVLRAFSHYRYRKYKADTYSSFKELLDHKETDSIVEESLYIKKIEPFLRLFNKENILFLIHEESASDPKGFIKKVYEFLDVDSSFIPLSIDKKINTTISQGKRFPRIEYLLNNLRWKIRSTPIGRAFLVPVRKIGLTKLITWFRGINRIAIKNDESITNEDYLFLWNFFHPSVKRLESTVDINTSEYWGNLSRFGK